MGSNRRGLGSCVTQCLISEFYEDPDSRILQVPPAAAFSRSISEFEATLGCTRTYPARIERALGNASTENLVKLTNALGIAVADLFSVTRARERDTAQAATTRRGWTPAARKRHGISLGCVLGYGFLRPSSDGEVRALEVSLLVQIVQPSWARPVVNHFPDQS